MKVFVWLLLAFASPVFAQVQIDHPWSRATPPGATVGAGYLTIKNQSAKPDRLVSASSPAAARVETHVTVKEGNTMRMREVKGYAIPAQGSFELKPGGAHLMFIDIKHPFKQGEKVPVTLRFEHAGEIAVELPVERMGASGGGHGNMKMH